VLSPIAAHAQQAEERAFEDAMRNAAPRAPISTDGDAEGRLGTQRMRRANSVASDILRRRMAQDRPSDLALLDEARDAEVIVVRGTYDRVQDVLRAIGVDHVVLPPRLIARLPLMSTQTVMLNCPGALSAPAIASVRRAVETGGFFVTTDWALSTVARAFPDTIRRTGRNTANDVVEVHIHDETEHPFLTHVAATDDRPRWWLEDASYPIGIVSPESVTLLISSERMKRRYGSDAIAVSFGHGEGTVLHTTSHFYLQQARLTSERERARGSRFAEEVGLGDEDVEALRQRGVDDVALGEVLAAYSVQQLLTNVIVEKRRRNVALLARFALRATRAATLYQSADTGSAHVAELREDFLLRPLDAQREGEMIRVRDLFGREGFIERSAVETREEAQPPRVENTARDRNRTAVRREPRERRARREVPRATPVARATMGCGASHTGGGTLPAALLFAALLFAARRRGSTPRF
jgi:hypothetical protein